jgi:hypothetical protein
MARVEAAAMTPEEFTLAWSVVICVWLTAFLVRDIRDRRPPPPR